MPLLASRFLPRGLLTCVLAACALVLGAVSLQAAGLYKGMSRQQAEQAMGLQGNYMSRGDKAFLLYPGEVRLVFYKGELVEAEGVELFDTASQAARAESVRRSTDGPGRPTAQLDVQQPAQGDAAGAAASGDVLAETFGEDATALAYTGTGENVDPLIESPISFDDIAGGNDEDSMDFEEEERSGGWLVRLIVDFVLSFICFRLACKYAGVHVWNYQAVGVALVDALAMVGGNALESIPEWGIVFSAAKLPFLLPVLAMAIVVPLITSAKSFQSVLSVVAGTQIIKLIGFLVLMNLILAMM